MKINMGRLHKWWLEMLDFVVYYADINQVLP